MTAIRVGVDAATLFSTTNREKPMLRNAGIATLLAMIFGFSHSAYSAETSLLCVRDSKLGFYVTFDDAKSRGPTWLNLGGVTEDGSFQVVRSVRANYELISLESVAPLYQLALTTSERDKVSVEYNAQTKTGHGVVTWVKDRHTDEFAKCRKVQLHSEEDGGNRG